MRQRLNQQQKEPHFSKIGNGEKGAKGQKRKTKLEVLSANGWPTRRRLQVQILRTRQSQRIKMLTKALPHLTKPRTRRLACGLLPHDDPKATQAAFYITPPPPATDTQADAFLAQSLATLVSAISNSLGPVNETLYPRLHQSPVEA